LIKSATGISAQQPFAAAIGKKIQVHGESARESVKANGSS